MHLADYMYCTELVTSQLPPPLSMSLSRFLSLSPSLSLSLSLSLSYTRRVGGVLLQCCVSVPYRDARPGQWDRPVVLRQTRCKGQ